MLRAHHRTAIVLAGLASPNAAVRIGSTWRVFNETSDEVFHITCGMEWLSAGRYTYETQHPPLARIVAALGPYWTGTKFHEMGSGAGEERVMLHRAADYFEYLTRARAGLAMVSKLSSVPFSSAMLVLVLATGYRCVPGIFCSRPCARSNRSFGWPRRSGGGVPYGASGAHTDSVAVPLRL